MISQGLFSENRISQRFRDQSIRLKTAFFLAIILSLFLIHVGGAWWFIQEQEQHGTAINKAGEQRMISQQIALNAHFMGMGEERGEELAAAATDFDQTLTALIEGSEQQGIPTPSSDIREQLLLVKAQWEPFYEHVQVVLKEPHTSDEFEQSLEYIETHHDQLLTESNEAAQLYEQDFAGKVEQFKQFLAGLLILDIIVLPLLLVLVDRQVLNPIQRTTTEARLVAEGNFDRPITVVPGTDEISTLSRSIAEMKSQLVTTIREAKQFEQAVEHSGHAIYITDFDGTIRYVNAEFESITGYDTEEIIGSDPSLLKSGVHEESFYAKLWETIKSGDVWESELVNQRKNGELYYIEQTIAPIIDENDEITHFVAINTEVTERRVREQQRQVLNRVLRHNLRNRLNLVDGYAQQLIDAPDETAVREHVRKMRAAIGDLLSLSEKSDRVESVSQGVSSAKPRIVCTIVTDLCETLQQQHPDTTITVDTPTSEWIVESQIETAIQEVLENALVHNNRSDPEIRVTVQSNTPRTGWVSIEIADNGPGIPESERTVLEEGTETPLMHGNGIGLWLVHWVVTLAGGEVTITDREPQGTFVTLALPGTSREHTDHDESQFVITAATTEELQG